MDSTRFVKGCCPLDCQDSCSWVAEVVDGRVTRLSGAKEHPFTRGALCAKVSDYQERTYASDRVLTPLRRVGAKGAGEFVRIPWDEAIGEIAGRFTDILDRYGAEALLPFTYLGSLGVVQRKALLRLFHALGASRLHGSICGASGNTLVAEGHAIGFDPEEMAHSRLILLWGANVLTTSHHQWHFMQEARKNHGARIVSIDPRRTRTAERSDEHVAIRPGTDAALAAGMAHVLVEEGLADLEYAGEVARDLDAYLEQVRGWSPQRAARTCGLEAAQIVRLALEFGTHRPATIRSGIAPQQNAHGEEFLRGLAALAILGGHWRSPGGGLFVETYPEFLDGRAARPDLAPREPRSLDMARLGHLLTDPDLAPPIMGLMVWGTNPAVHQPNAGLTWQGLAREDLFTVVLEHFLNDTTRFADIVLPSTTQLEHFDIQGAWGHHYISANQAAIAPLGEAKTHGDVMRLLAERMGLDHPALRETDEQIAASALPEGVQLDELLAEGWIKRSPPRPELRGAAVPISGMVPEPNPLPQPGMLRLLTPKAHYFLNSSFGNMPRQRRAEVRPTLEIHPDDARARGLVDGQEVLLANDRGSVRAWLQIREAIRPGVVALPGKWWSRPDETGAVGNLLTPSAWSPGGQPAYNDCHVTIAAVEA